MRLQACEHEVIWKVWSRVNVPWRNTQIQHGAVSMKAAHESLKPTLASHLVLGNRDLSYGGLLEVWVR